MIALDKFKVTAVSESDNTGEFQIGPLPKGYGQTLGNTIRRILLSSVPGAAITGVKVAGVRHEYATIDGVQDDVITMNLNIKEIAVRKYVDEPRTLKLSVKGKKGSVVEVKAGDFDLPSDVEIINPDKVITHLTSNVELNIEITVESGVGYAYPDEDKRKELGVMPLDAIYSPVKRVELKIENARLGQFTDLDQVNLVIVTNGTITPKDVLLKSAEIYDELANRLVDQLGGDSVLAKEELEKHEEVETVEEEKILVSQLNLSTRLTNALLNSGISDLRNLKDYNREEVANFKGMGKKSMTELEAILDERGIVFSIS